MRNLLIGKSSVNRSSNYLYYGGTDTDGLNALSVGEIGLYWVRKSAGPNADIGPYTATNDDILADSGKTIQKDSDLNAVINSDAMMFVEGLGSGNGVNLGQVIELKNFNFKVLEYLAPQAKVQTILVPTALINLIAAAYLPTITVRLSIKNPNGELGNAKEFVLTDRLVLLDSASSIATRLKGLIEASSFYTKYITSVTTGTSGGAQVIITWKTDGDIKSDRDAATSGTPFGECTISTGTAYKAGNGTGAQIAALEKEYLVRSGYNYNDIESFPSFRTDTSKNYNMIVISHMSGDQDALGTRQHVPQEQYIAIDTDGTELLVEIVGILTDLSQKVAVKGVS